MEPKAIRFERVVGRKPVIDETDRETLVDEGQRIREADSRDGTLVFLEAAFDDALAEEPDYRW